MTDAQDLTMAAHAKMLARSADALAKELGKPFPPWMTPRESSHGLASLVAQLADIVTELAATHDRIHREDDLR